MKANKIKFSSVQENFVWIVWKKVDVESGNCVFLNCVAKDVTVVKDTMLCDVMRVVVVLVVVVVVVVVLEVLIMFIECTQST